MPLEWRPECVGSAASRGPNLRPSPPGSSPTCWRGGGGVLPGSV